MDDTTQSRVSDAAATRKRRSSILKSQRPPRTPFCELEFNVATPTDVTKSRRVSFSRRTGIAEFATNEATTTWKNFYEEHNKSLESSGNDSNSGNQKQAISHLGNRLFDQQFEEEEGVDFTGSVNPGMNMSLSVNNIHFTQQGEYTDSKLTAPKNKFELSEFTEQQNKVFEDDLVIPCMGEVTDRMNINFSAIQQIGENDDLDEIQKDLQRKSNVVCHRPFSDRQNLSEYIEVDLDMTHVGMVNDESDMSITDTIHSPKVQDISKTATFDKKVSISKDWVIDKENIAVNPYITPRESINFAVNEEPDQVLVFDGKRLIVQTEKPKNDTHRQTVLSSTSDKPPQKNTYDDLPNFIDDAQSKNLLQCNSESHLGLNEMPDIHGRLSETRHKHRTIIYDDDDDLGNMSVTQPIPQAIPPVTDKCRTLLFENDTGDVSITQAIPSKIIDKEKRQTIVYENCNISMTQAIPAVLLPNDNDEKRKTIEYDEEASDISMTQALPVNIIANTATKRRTIVFDDDAGDVSFTQVIPSIILKEDKKESPLTMINNDASKAILQTVNLSESPIPERRRTVVFESDTCNISITQALPSNILQSQKLNSTSYEDDFNISMTQAVPANILLQDNLQTNRRRTVVYEEDAGNLSITQAVPSNQIISRISNQQSNKELLDTVVTNEALPIKDLDTNKRRTVVFKNDDGNISMTQAVNLNQEIPGLIKNEKVSDSAAVISKRRTIVFDGDAADISVTQVVSMNHIVQGNYDKQNYIETTDTPLNVTANNERKTVIFNDDVDISLTQAVNVNEVLRREEEKKVITHEDLKVAIDAALHSQNDPSVDRRRTIVYDNDEGDISMTEAINENIVLCNGERKEKSIVFGNMTAILENRDLFMEIDKLTGSSPENKVKMPDISMTESSPETKIKMSNVSMSQSNKKRVTIAYENDNDVSISQGKNENVSPKPKQEERLTKVSDGNDHTTLSKPIPAGLSAFEDKHFDCSRKSISKHDTMLVNISNAISDVLVYQAVMKPDKDESEALEPIRVPNEKVDEVPLFKTTNEIDTISNNSAKICDEIQNPKEEDLELAYADTATSYEAPKSKLSAISINVPQDCAVEILPAKPKDAVLNELLDMSHSSLDGDLEDKNLMIRIVSEQPSLEEAAKPKPESSDDTFYITKDDEGQTDPSENDIRKDTDKLAMPQICQSHLPIEYQSEENQEIVEGVQTKLSKIKSVLKKFSPRNKNISNSDTECKESLKKSRRESSSKSGKSFRMANDTNDLLDMLSDFTDKRKSRNVEPSVEEKEDLPEPVSMKKKLSLEYKEETDQQTRGCLSFVPKRQPMALSREDLLNNLSMASAALQRYRYEFDDTDDIEDTATETPDQNISRKKSVRLSTEVVKTLHFDEDDSLSETSERTKTHESPLKKTAFGEVSYMKDTKAKVIPEYLGEVSNSIKELMDDLVKPMADVLPFQTTTMDKGVRKCPSTCSTQIQANLLTSSEVDLNTELYSNSETMHDYADKESMKKIDSIDVITDAVNRSMSQVLKMPKPIMTVSHSEKLSEMFVETENIYIQPVRPKSMSPSNYLESDRPGRVIIFDPANPFNNVLLDPPEPVEAHRYNPIQSNETICAPVTSHSAQVSINDMENDARTKEVSFHYRIESAITLPSKSADTDKTDTQSSSNTGKSTADQWTDPKIAEFVKDIEVNTDIAMKGNKELLEASSSLTLVDDALIQSNIAIDSSKTMSHEERIKSAIHVIYKEEDLPEKLDSDFTSNDEIVSEIQTKTKKRVYSPSKRDKHKHCTLSSLEVTPKPASKIQKRSISPEYDEQFTKLIPEKDYPEKEESTENYQDKKSGTTVTVQQVITMVHIEAPNSNTETIDMDTSNIDSKISRIEVPEKDKEILSDPTDCYMIESFSPAVSQCNVLETASSDICSSLSSKNMRDDTSQISSPSQISRTSNRSSNMDWLPESGSSGMISMKLTESDTGVDIITKIDMMPFMGSHECEWESSHGDTWSFRLLHSRLRLSVQFVTDRVRHDTRVLNVALETLHQDKRNTIALLCVNFGAEMMRHLISRGCTVAEEVPKLVRKLAAAARLAARWARAMHDAWARLAYTVTPDGWLTLKVANTCVRTVWEVSMRLELQVEDARSAPWPRACGVCVTRVVPHPGPLPTEREVERVLASTPQDWGHVPRTIWKIFKYLKHKRRDSGMTLEI